jgi:hypothetical protein
LASAEEPAVDSSIPQAENSAILSVASGVVCRYNHPMGGLLQPSSTIEDRDTSKRTILIAIAVVVVIAGIVALLLREGPRAQSGPPPYAPYVKLSDLKMSQAQNFAGFTVTYVDGTVTNLGNKTVTHAVVRVTFRDAYGQVAQVEEVPLKVLETGGPYLDTADLSAMPLAPGQNKPFRLIFERISQQWNMGYPELQVSDVSTK